MLLAVSYKLVTLLLVLVTCDNSILGVHFVTIINTITIIILLL